MKHCKEQGKVNEILPHWNRAKSHSWRFAVILGFLWRFSVISKREKLDRIDLSEKPFTENTALFRTALPYHCLLCGVSVGGWYLFSFTLSFGSHSNLRGSLKYKSLPTSSKKNKNNNEQKTIKNKSPKDSDYNRSWLNTIWAQMKISIQSYFITHLAENRPKPKSHRPRLFSLWPLCRPIAGEWLKARTRTLRQSYSNPDNTKTMYNLNLWIVYVIR